MTFEQVRNVVLASDVGRANLLTNGGFEIWQRGNGPYTTNAAWTADRWSIFISGTDTISVSLNNANQDSGTNCAAITYVHGSGTDGRVYQPYKTTEIDLRGRTISLSMRARTATANAARAAIQYDGTGGTTVYSSYHTGSGAYQTLTVTATIPADASIVYAVLSISVSATVYLDNAMLVVGSQAADYAPLHPADDLARCLRYYEVLGQNGELIASCYSGGAGEGIGIGVSWRAVKPVTPTATKVGNLTVTNCPQPAVGVGPGATGMQIYAASIAAGHFQFSSTASAYYTIEANP